MTYRIQARTALSRSMDPQKMDTHNHTHTHSLSHTNMYDYTRASVNDRDACVFTRSCSRTLYISQEQH